MASLLLPIIYLAFISLGLPDSLLGSAWPTIHLQFSVPVSYAGIAAMIIAAGTIISSLMSDRLTARFGTGRVTAASVFLTALALFGFSISGSFPILCLWAIPYGLGAGSIDASLNNYVALHYASRHMSWLHCMWGVGASVGPYIMGMALVGGQGWSIGYRYIGFIQLTLTVLLFLSIPLWKKRPKEESSQERVKPMTLREVLRVSGVPEVMLCFFCYCALEQTAGLWASSYLVMQRGVDAVTAAGYAGLFFLGITAGRAVNGFLTIKFSDRALIIAGETVIAAGIIAISLPLGQSAALIGFVIIGIGCAPIYPGIIHSTPAHFGTEHSQAIIGVQMASAYVGTCLMPPLFGLIAQHITAALLPVYLMLLLCLMAYMFSRLEKKTGNRG